MIISTCKLCEVVKDHFTNYNAFAFYYYFYLSKELHENAFLETVEPLIYGNKFKLYHFYLNCLHMYYLVLKWALKLSKIEGLSQEFFRQGLYQNCTY